MESFSSYFKESSFSSCVFCRMHREDPLLRVISPIGLVRPHSIAAYTGQNSYAPLNDLFETDRKSYDPPNRISI